MDAYMRLQVRFSLYCEEHPKFLIGIYIVATIALAVAGIVTIIASEVAVAVVFIAMSLLFAVMTVMTTRNIKKESEAKLVNK